MNLIKLHINIKYFSGHVYEVAFFCSPSSSLLFQYVAGPSQAVCTLGIVWFAIPPEGGTGVTKYTNIWGNLAG